MLRVLLDTNVWSRIAESGDGLPLRMAARKAGAQIIAAPSVLYELARIPNATRRSVALRLITEQVWHRLMPEAYLEAEEIVSAIRRYRPDWIVQEADLREYDRLVYDWSRRNKPAARRLRSPNKAGVWERLRVGSDVVEDHFSADRHGLDMARAEAYTARREALDQNVHTAGPLRSVRARYYAPRLGWRGDDFEPWRHEAAESLAFHLFHVQGDPYRDWIAPFVNLGAIDPTSWLTLWLYEVQAAETPRQWARWAIRHLQRFRKVSDGAPCDVQLAAYLTDADVLLSADRPFVELVSEARQYAPAPLASAVALPSGAAAAEAAIAWLDEL